MALDRLQFLSATLPGYNTGGVKRTGESNYHQANAGLNKGVSNTEPRYFGIPTTEMMERAAQFAEINNQYQLTGEIKPLGVDNPYKPTGTGELSPTLEGRADEIEDCPWREYYA